MLSEKARRFGRAYLVDMSKGFGERELPKLFETAEEAAARLGIDPSKLGDTKEVRRLMALALRFRNI